MLKAENLSKRYGRRTVLNRVSMSIAPGEFVAIMGPSGSGKTTLLNLLSGLDKPTSGRVNAPVRKQRACVIQGYNLRESLNPRRNATLTARFSGRRPARGRVEEVFDSLGLAGLESRLPAQLSGGQQQRVAVARALLAQAPYIFADEPTGALDDATASPVLSHLRAVARDGASVIMVTHSHLAAEAAARVISLEEVAHAGVA